MTDGYRGNTRGSTVTAIDIFGEEAPVDTFEHVSSAGHAVFQEAKRKMAERAASGVVADIVEDDRKPSGRRQDRRVRYNPNGGKAFQARVR